MLSDLTQEPLTRLLVNATRLGSTAGPELAEAHRRVGRALGRVLANFVPLEDYDIQHVTGPSRGVRIKEGAEPVILALMRAGLFIAEGIWETLPGSSLVPWASRGGTPLPVIPVNGRTVIVVDSVINTGESLRPVLDAVTRHRPGGIAVGALVAHRPTAQSLEREYPQVNFVVARLSDHSYTGRGVTDTGARLFGTTSWPSER